MRGLAGICHIQTILDLLIKAHLVTPTTTLAIAMSSVLIAVIFIIYRIHWLLSFIFNQSGICFVCHASNLSCERKLST